MSSNKESNQAGKYIAWALGAFVGAGGGTAALGSLVEGVSYSEFVVVKSELNRLRIEFEKFRDAGQRWTRADAMAQQAANNSRLKEIETRLTLLREAHLELTYQVKWGREHFKEHIEE